MKRLVRILAIVVSISFGLLLPHQPIEGLFSSALQEPQCERRQDDNSSRVLLVDGSDDFQQMVIRKSWKTPVVVKIFSPQNADSVKVKYIYQDVADVFGGKIAFTSMNLFTGRATISENYKLIAQIMKRYGLKRLELPTFLFFNQGQLSMPAPMVHGFYTKENLISIINQKFFS